MPAENRELDAAIASEVCGWTALGPRDSPRPGGGLYGIPPDPSQPPFSLLSSINLNHDRRQVWEVPFYSLRLDSCRIAELEMERRGLKLQYAIALGEMLPVDPTLFVSITADAETRCRAMLAAIREATP